MTQPLNQSSSVKPFGYYVSSTNPNIQDKLDKISSLTGIWFENVTLGELHTLLTYCAGEADPNRSIKLNLNRNLTSMESHLMSIIDHLPANIKVSLVAIIAQVILSRGQQGVNNY